MRATGKLCYSSSDLNSKGSSGLGTKTDFFQQKQERSVMVAGAEHVHKERWKGWEYRLRERDALEICAVLPGVG